VHSIELLHKALKLAPLAFSSTWKAPKHIQSFNEFMKHMIGQKLTVLLGEFFGRITGWDVESTIQGSLMPGQYNSHPSFHSLKLFHGVFGGCAIG
jgi:hypothetical protein